MTTLDERAETTMPAFTVAADLASQIPADVRIVTWQLDHDGIKGQMQVWPTDDATIRANLRLLAGLFGLEYVERLSSGGYRVEAVGRWNGVRVSLWDYAIGPEVIKCGCGCHHVTACSCQHEDGAA